ncbi:hypothetical protein HanRHA438_Chr10g0455911 [Helianthus annuus]|nr:hypothetical protein HanRHA438_Chr10g0455911 [Helianthus annuus]
MPIHCVIRNVLGIVFYILCLLLYITLFFVIVFYALRFTNHVLSYYMFPPVSKILV